MPSDASGYPQDVHKATELRFATSWRRIMPVVVGGVGVMLIIGGVGWNYIKGSHNASGDETINSSGKGVKNKELGLVASVAGVKSVKPIKLIKIDVEGAVEKPGIIEVPDDSRIQDVLITAGGFSPKADRKYISKSINLAQKIQDGSKIYIPAVDEKISMGSLQPATSSESENDLININTASETQLDSLPGVGPVTAQKIMAGRPYQVVGDLLAKKVVGQSLFDKIKEKITTY